MKASFKRNRWTKCMKIKFELLFIEISATLYESDSYCEKLLLQVKMSARCWIIGEFQIVWQGQLRLFFFFFGGSGRHRWSHIWSQTLSERIPMSHEEILKLLSACEAYYIDVFKCMPSLQWQFSIFGSKHFLTAYVP